jgi:glucose/arabinose dehydrogenase
MHRFASLLFALLAAAPAVAAVNLDEISLPEGFAIDVYAEVPKARSLALGANNVVYVSNRRADSIYAIVPGARTQVVEIDDGLETPNGIAYFEGDLYVAEIERVLVYRDIDGRLGKPPQPETLDIELPDESHHGWRYIGFGPDGKLYISIGAPCNICDREGFARIERMNPDGSEREVYAEGIRNSVGMTWNPENGELWFTDNGRDMLGDDLPAGELNHAPNKGMHFGYPFCHGGDLPDPEFGRKRACSEFVPPAQKLGPHVAPLGLSFYSGTMFPEEYRGQVFIAEHGSWNRSKKIGYRVTLVRLEDGKPVSYEVFADGWLDGQTSNGRPVDVLMMPDGALLLSDDANGLVYRISYEGKE